MYVCMDISMYMYVCNANVCMYACKGVHLYICMDDFACMYASHMAISSIQFRQSKKLQNKHNGGL